MSTELNKAYREVLGQGLKQMRTDKGLSTYAVRNASGLNGEMIKNIEDGSSAYTIDSLMNYCRAIDVYMLFGDKAGKKKGPLEPKHMMEVIKKNDSKLK